MKKADFFAVLAPIVEESQRKPYAYWVDQFADQPIVLEVKAPDGTDCQVEINVLWDDGKEGPIRVMLSIDDGGWRAFAPVTESFVIAEDGTLLGE